MKLCIKKAACGYEIEPLKTAFGFKGSALTCLWQTVVQLKSENCTGLGLGVQSVLWSDQEIFRTFGEEAGNKLMFRLTEYACGLCYGAEFENPQQLLDMLFPQVLEFARAITNSQNLRTTFVLNALVPLDLAAWQLWAKENGKTSFDDICPFDGQKQALLANIPLITYNTPVEDVVQMAKNGVSLLKIKIGSDPNKDNDRNAMLHWDTKRLLQIHRAVADIPTKHTQSGHILYYLDANGRYDTKERLQKLLGFAEENGILDRILLLEEPFDEQNKVFVGDLPVCIAADESAHALADVQERYALGYRALTLKPIAKTLSMTIRMAQFAREKGMHCFCADLTVNPVMVSWNQCVAARLNRMPQMRIGIMESNGSQNYINWETMQQYHSLHPAAFTQCQDGVFRLDKDFYEMSGGVFTTPDHYTAAI